MLSILRNGTDTERESMIKNHLREREAAMHTALNVILGTGEAPLLAAK